VSEGLETHRRQIWELFCSDLSKHIPRGSYPEEMRAHVFRSLSTGLVAALLGTLPIFQRLSDSRSPDLKSPPVVVLSVLRRTADSTDNATARRATEIVNLRGALMLQLPARAWLQLKR
jgi:hypothetical protein